MFSFSLDKILQKQREEFSFGGLIRQIFVDDWMMKLTALIITLALWFGVTGLRTPTTERLKNVALKMRFSNDIEITNDPVEEVDVVLTGDKRKMDQIRKEDIIVLVDLGDAQPGEQTVQLTPENVNLDLPSGVKLEEIQPSKIAIKLEIVQQREIPVKAITEYDPPDGFEIYGEPAVVPTKVPVRGPASYINALEYIYTEKIDLSDHKEDFTAQQVPLNISNSRVTVIDEASVDVFFRIGEKRIERLFIVPVENAGETGRTATIILYGGRELINSIKSEDLKIELTTSDAGVKLLSPTLPASIQGKVEIRKMQINPN